MFVKLKSSHHWMMGFLIGLASQGSGATEILANSAFFAQAASTQSGKEKIMTTVHQVSVKEAYKAIQDASIGFIDVREVAEVAEASAKGAVNYPMSSLDPKTFDQASGLKKTQKIYILCRSGNRSNKVAQALQSEGFKELYNIQGGILAWKEAGLP